MGLSANETPDRLLHDIYGEAAAWLRPPNYTSPFQCKQPIDLLANGGAPAIDVTRRAVETLALQRSL